MQEKTFALWGLAFKPNTDDMREAPSKVLMEELWRMGAHVNAYDPEAMSETRRIYGNVKNLTLHDSKEDTLLGADALIIMTEWPEFKAPNFTAIKENMASPVIFDGRNLFTPGQISELGINYYSIGRPKGDA